MSAALAVIGAMSMIVTGCSDRMGRGWDWNRMRMQPRYEPYRGSAFFADGKVMQLPPSGTLSRESGAIHGTPPLSPVTPELIARGRSQFQIYCAVCHGVRGDGVSIVASNMEEPRPPSLLVPPVSLMPPDVIAAVVTSGLGQMPSFAAELSVADRRAVAEYVATLQHGSTAAVAESQYPAGIPRR